MFNLVYKMNGELNRLEVDKYFTVDYVKKALILIPKKDAQEAVQFFYSNLINYDYIYIENVEDGSVSNNIDFNMLENGEDIPSLYIKINKWSRKGNDLKFIDIESKYKINWSCKKDNSFLIFYFKKDDEVWNFKLSKLGFNDRVNRNQWRIKLDDYKEDTFNKLFDWIEDPDIKVCVLSEEYNKWFTDYDIDILDNLLYIQANSYK